jgi:hypothetical protein
MSTERASIFDNDPDIDVSGFTPKNPKPAEQSPPREAIQAASEAARFTSREPVASQTKKPVKKRAPRIHRTGRNVHFAAKVTLATNDAIYDVTAKQGWVIGETLQHAVEALQEKLASEKKKAVGEGAA